MAQSSDHRPAHWSRHCAGTGSSKRYALHRIVESRHAVAAASSSLFLAVLHPQRSNYAPETLTPQQKTIFITSATPTRFRPARRRSSCAAGRLTPLAQGCSLRVARAYQRLDAFVLERECERSGTGSSRAPCALASWLSCLRSIRPRAGSAQLGEDDSPDSQQAIDGVSMPGSGAKSSGSRAAHRKP